MPCNNHLTRSPTAQQYWYCVAKRKRPFHNSLLVFVILAAVLNCSSGFTVPATKAKGVYITAAPFQSSSHRQITSLSLAKPQRSPKSKRGGGGGKTPKKQQKTSNNTKKKSPQNKQPAAAGGGGGSHSRAPPWQVLSKKDAKKNVEREKVRRERIKQGLDEEPEELEDVRVSHDFASPVERSFLGWKRFNPASAASGMKMVASVLGKQLPPRLGVPEVAFLGRSNVGKSSLLNRLSSYSKREAGYKDEARVGKTPGATASVNLYAFYDKKEKPLLGFVDLPGFGYAKLSKDVKEAVQQTAENYLGKRQELVLGVLLVDIRREPSEDDRIVLAALFDMGVPIVVVATKVDKLSKNEIEGQLEKIREGLGLPEGQPLSVSSVTGDGTKQLWNIIFEACEAGVDEFKKKFERGAVEQDERDEEELLPNDDEEFYSQGYDWIQDSGAQFYDDDDDFDEFQVTDSAPGRVPEESLDMASIKDLKKLARRMERNKQI